MAKILVEGPERHDILRRLFELLGDRAGGVILLPVLQGGALVGYKARTHTGREALLAHVTGASLYRAGRFKVNVVEIDAAAVPAIRDAVKSRETVLIGEIGRMLLFSDKFRDAVREAFESARSVVAAVQDKPHGFVDRLRSLPGVVSEASLPGILEKLKSPPV